MTTAFAKKIGQPLTRRSMATLQINIGKLCNLACRHCHVDSSPRKKRENMASDAIDRIIELLGKSQHIKIVDITGGAPELNPHFRRLVEAARGMDKDVWDRCNLTVLDEPGQEDTVDFFVKNKVRIIASLPCYSRDNVEKQRGDGVFGSSIRNLQKLNEMGYAQEGSGLYLDLVYNPVGASLPPSQAGLKADYKQALKEDFNISFDELYTITNMPIKRFLVDLKRDGKADSYMELLEQNFNAGAVENVMCRDLISISWDGKIFDCDFNQALEMPAPEAPQDIWALENFDDLLNHKIAVADHCYGCTAGAGSSCSGALV